MERGKRLKNAVVILRKVNKIRQKEVECIIFTHQDFRNSNAPIELYDIEKWCQITTWGARYLLFSDVLVEECVEAVEVEDERNKYWISNICQSWVRVRLGWKCI